MFIVKGGLNLDINLIITYLAVIIFIYILARVFSLPIKKIWKLIINSIIGALGLYIINLVGGLFDFHIGINIFTILFVGILGVPGTLFLVIMKLLF